MKAVLNRTYSYFKRVTQTFNTSASFQEYTVPQGVTEIEVDCVASKGADGSGTGKGGYGGRVQCHLQVTPGQTLYFYVGAIASSNTTAEYNASDIRTDNTGVTNSTSLNSRLLVAGGGGSGAYDCGGGAGGGLTGGNGAATGGDYGGKGGSQSAGGSGGNNGSFGLGGNGKSYGNNMSGAGGAGWYGGGSGTGFLSSRIGAGGAGSSYTSGNCYNVVHTQGYWNNNGYITIKLNVPSTESDYDFRLATIEAKAVKQDDKFYAVKSYNKGEYFGE